MLWTLTLAVGLPGLGAGCVSTAGSGQGTTTTSGNKFLAFFMQPAAKSPAASQRNDPTSLFSKKKQPGADLYVTMAQLREQAGDVAEAETLYQKALKADSKSLAALMGYAHLEDRRGNLESAVKLYKRAISAHPNEVAPYNDLGLCFHRQGKLNESAQTMRHAVGLQPDRKLYHNNLAMVLVDLGQNDEAFKELLITGPPAAAHYNLANLLHRKGDDSAAVDHFREALALDPSLQAADQWLARLAPPTPPADANALLAGRPRRQTRVNAEPPASPVASPSESSPSPPAARMEQPVQAPVQPPAARTVSTRRVKSAPASPGSGSTAAPQAPNSPQFLYADSAPPSPAAALPPAAALAPADSVPRDANQADSRRARASLSPNPPLFLQAEDPLAADSVADVPMPDAPAPKRTNSLRVQYPDRHRDTAGVQAPLPGDAPRLDAATIAQDDEIENSSLIVPAEPNNYGG